MKCTLDLLKLSILVHLLSLSVSAAEDKGGSSDKDSGSPDHLFCYTCNNGKKLTAKCVGEISKNEKGFDIGNSTWRKGENGSSCNSVGEFFAEFNEATGEWIKRTISILRKTASRRRRGASGVGVKDGTSIETAFCVTISTFQAGLDTPEVFRDCIHGEPTDIQKNFRSELDFLKKDFEIFPKPTGSINETRICWEKKVKGEKGTNLMRVCLCKTDFCNNLKADDGAAQVGAKSVFVTIMTLTVIVMSSKL